MARGGEGAAAVAASVAEALEEGKAGGLGERSTEHAVILCFEDGSWKDAGRSTAVRVGGERGADAGKADPMRAG